MKNQQLEGQLRHLLTSLAGFLVAFNFLPEDSLTVAQTVITNLVAALFAAVAFYRSYVTKSPPPNKT